MVWMWDWPASVVLVLVLVFVCGVAFTSGSVPVFRSGSTSGCESISTGTEAGIGADPVMTATGKHVRFDIDIGRYW